MFKRKSSLYSICTLLLLASMTFVQPHSISTTSAQKGDDITNMGGIGVAPQTRTLSVADSFQEYTDYPSFKTGFGRRLREISFQEVPLGTILTTQYSALGVEFRDGDDVTVPSVYFESDGVGVDGHGRVRILLSEPAYAIGSDFPGALTIDIYDTEGGTLLYTSSDFAGSGAGFFGGVVSDQGFSYVVLRDWFDDAVYLDNIYIGGGVKAVVVKSWADCSSGNLIWDSLNANWADYGVTFINIDYAYPGLCDGPVTYEALAASEADVMIISDPAGLFRQYSAAEVADIKRYAQEGHNIIGTYLLFQYNVTDNRELAPLFGLKSNLDYASMPTSPAYDLIVPTDQLFVGMTGTYTSTGYPYSQVPSDDYSWDLDDLDGARYVAKTSDSEAAIMVYLAPHYHAIYITNMPEYQGGVEDERFFYNAITYRSGSIHLPLVLRGD